MLRTRAQLVIWNDWISWSSLECWTAKVNPSTTPEIYSLLYHVWHEMDTPKCTKAQQNMYQIHVAMLKPCHIIFVFVHFILLLLKISLVLILTIRKSIQWTKWYNIDPNILQVGEVLSFGWVLGGLLSHIIHLKFVVLSLLCSPQFKGVFLCRV